MKLFIRILLISPKLVRKIDLLSKFEKIPEAVSVISYILKFELLSLIGLYVVHMYNQGPNFSPILFA